jgi:hypothetical protein
MLGVPLVSGLGLSLVLNAALGARHGPEILVCSATPLLIAKPTNDVLPCLAYVLAPIFVIAAVGGAVGGEVALIYKVVVGGGPRDKTRRGQEWRA